MDAYGSWARASALADYAELSALVHDQSTLADIENLIRHYAWGPQLLPHLRDGDPQGDMEPDLVAEPVRGAERVALIADERLRVLGDLYPFTWDRNGWKVRSAPDGDVYLVLLAMTVAHAWHLPVPPGRRVEDLLERTVKRFLLDCGWHADLMSTQAGPGGFGARLRRATLPLGLWARVKGQAIRRRARDEGVDVLAASPWGPRAPRDDRPGTLVLLAQATCEATDGWKKKLGDPSPKHWGRILGEPGAVVPALAVPHHAEREHLRWLAAEVDGVIIDRLRLTAGLKATTKDELATLSDVRDAGVSS
ncbi:MAG: hypothetical protein HY744_15350 [Deltaproteobacteria bacterium]|nr:hypothetical protein [Deltaproteobacteria bacterium]